MGYVVALEPKGFVLFSSDDETPPVKLYSDDGDFEALPDGLRKVIELELLEDNSTVGLSPKDNPQALENITRFSGQWAYLTASDSAQDGIEGLPTASPGTTILTTAWHQNDPYNLFCPEASGGPGGRALAGCTATALAQVLRHHKQPIAVAQNYTYIDNSGSCTGSHSIADAGMGAYDWLNMPSSISTASPDAQIRAVGQLIYHCAVALKSNFEAGGTGAYPSSIPSVLSEFFDYTCTDYSRKNSYTSSEWYARISSDIDNNRPVFYAMWEADGSSGHAVVCDGYRNGDEIHLDLGWSGAWTAWYNIDSVIASGYTWTSHTAVFNIQPPSQEGDVEIWTCEQLQQVSTGGAYPWDAHCKLMTDIDCSSISNFLPIGRDYEHYFRGTFDGQGHRIYNLNIERPTEEYVGLFSALMDKAVVKNLILECHNIWGLGTVGTLAGENAGTVVNCRATVLNLAAKGKGKAGGLVGLNSGMILNCQLLNPPGKISEIKSAGTYVDNIGGLVGENAGAIKWSRTEGQVFVGPTVSQGDRGGGIVGSNSGTVTECNSVCRVGGSDAIGGIAGSNYSTGEILDCYYGAGKKVDSSHAVGGIAGKNEGIVERCYVTGGVEGGDYMGALVGKNYGTISASFWLCSTGLPPIGGGSSNPTNTRCLTQEEMRQRAPFESAGWDFVNESAIGTADIWCICQGDDYPKHTWPFIIGDMDGDDDVDFADYAELAKHWLQTDASFWCGEGGTNFTDDGDGNVNFLDFATMIGERHAIE